LTSQQAFADPEMDGSAQYFSAPKRSNAFAVLLLAVMLLGLAWLFWGRGLVPQTLIVAGGTLIFVAGLISVRARISRRSHKIVVSLLRRFIENDAAPSFVSDGEGAILARNGAAVTRFPQSDCSNLAGTLRAVFSNPPAVLYRLLQRAGSEGSAREDIVTRRGHIRLAVHQMGAQRWLWRIEDMPDRGAAGRNAETSPVPMITVGRSGAVLFMNDAARNLVGERVKSLDRLFVALPLHPGEVNAISTITGDIDVVVFENTRVAGRRELYFLPAKSAAGIGGGQISVFETLPVPMIKVAGSGEILMANRLANELLAGNARAGEMLGNLMQGLSRPVEGWLRETFEGKSLQNSEFLRLTRQDKEVFVQITLSRASEGGEHILIAVLSDATELKTLEAKFVQSQKMQAIGQLAGGVAHDFNNLLTAISGHCDLLLLRHDQGDQDYGDLVQINQNANRAAALVSQLLAFSRKQTLRPEILDLRDTLSDLTHLLNRLVGEKVTLTLSHDPVLGPIRADKRQLEQVLMNLVVNARDAMPAGGEIRIETEVVSLRESLQRDRATVPVGEYVTVRVSDDGVGIPPDKLQKIFEPFYTTKRVGEGTGLGLSTAYGIIKQTGGFIFVDSVLGSGTAFTLYFPVYETEPDTVPVALATPPVSAPKHGEGVVLLVEDEAPVRAFASRALRLRGYTVLEAESAEDALHTLEDPDLSVDVFVTDVVMPGMDGPSWVREALKTRPNVRVVFVSGYAEGAFGESQPSLPNSVFLPKPFSLNQLTDTVHQQLF
jgi:two-component system, cell cycle sensor histidine kinase and response regulator CckA